jgi:class 3 adenylate cyclase
VDQLIGWRLVAARLAYFLVLLLSVLTFAHAIPHWLQVTLAARSATGAGDAPSGVLVRIDLAVALAVPVACAAVAAIILRYRSRDWFGLFASIEALLFGLAIAGPWSSVPLADPWSQPTRVAIKLAEIAILMALYTFPSGRFVPRWTRSLLVVFAGWAAIGLAIPAVDPVVARGVWQLAFVAFFLSGLVAQGYRYTTVSAGTEKRQAVWVSLGLAVVVIAYAVWSLLDFAVRNQTLATLADIALQLASILAVLLFGIAMIRFRLYDIDLVINRTVLYGTSTAALIVVFAALSFVSKGIIEATTGHSSDIMTIPLIVAAAVGFGPLQRRLRPVVDRLLPPRAVLTLFFTDICESTARAVALGDERWRDMLSKYRATVRRGLKRFRGSEMDTAGDGFFAVFDRPSDALSSAELLRDQLHELGLDSRFGLHAGECEVRGEKVSGAAVITAARVMATAGANEIVISAAVHDALGHRGEPFGDLGDHPLKGLPGQWHLYRLVSASDG